MENLKKYSIIDLHLHLDGSLSAKAIIEVAKEEGIKLPTYDEEELYKYLRVPKECKSLNEYLERFDIPNYVLQTKNGLRKCTLDLLNRLHEQGLKYVEIRMAPQLSTQKGLSQEDVVKTLLEVREESPIRVNFILCMMRFENNQKANLETVEIARKYFGRGVVAVDLAGAEALWGNKLFENELKLVKKYGLNLTVHSGEATDYKEVDLALEYGADRIGHGVHSIESEETVEILKKLRKPLEICPTSNIDTKSYKSYEELPIRALFDAGVLVTINTDDMTVSNTTLLDEFKVIEKLGFSESEIRQLTLNAIDAAFISEEEKNELRNLI